MDCGLNLLDLYFSKFDFEQTRKKHDKQYSMSIHIDYSVDVDDSNRVRITLDSKFTNKEKSIVVNLETVGIFQLINMDMSDENYEQLVKTNTVAIMFPYIRSQVSLITTQPGLEPILIPPINVDSLLNSTNDKK